MKFFFLKLPFFFLNYHFFNKIVHCSFLKVQIEWDVLKIMVFLTENDRFEKNLKIKRFFDCFGERIKSPNFTTWYIRRSLHTQILWTKYQVIILIILTVYFYFFHISYLRACDLVCSRFKDIPENSYFTVKHLEIHTYYSVTI